MRDKPDRERFDHLREDIGEDPARFLDRDLLSDSNSRMLALARIRGIDRYAVASAWLAVERQIERGPRARIVDQLEERKEFLSVAGDRDERTPEDPQVLPLFVDIEDSVDIEHADAASARIRQLATDGGSDR